MTLHADPTASAFKRLRRLAKSRRTPREYCELCSASLAPRHEHLVEINSRNIICSCEACAILFTGQIGVDSDANYRRVPKRVAQLSDFRITDAQWDSLLVPINMAFFYDSTPQQKVIAVYPSPAGATESTLGLDTWNEIAEANPIVLTMERDVEALLVNRIDRSKPYQYYLVPIDRCYELVGIIRVHWRGLSGGTEVWHHIHAFFTGLNLATEIVQESTDHA